MKFGVRECADVVLRAKTTQKIGNKIFYKNEPVCYFDTLKTSTFEGAATTVYAQGGRGNARLVSWDGERTVTFTMEDALISPVGLSILTGAGLIEASEKKPIYVHTTERLEVKEDQIDGKGMPILYLTEEPFDNMDKEYFIYVMGLDDSGEVVTEPFIYSYGNDIQDGQYVISFKGRNNFYKGQPYEDNAIVKMKNINTVLVDYYVKKEADAFEINITPDKFGGAFYLEASTLWRDQASGADYPAEFVIPNCRVQSNFSFTLASSGDPSTFTFTMDAFPDYTRWDKKTKVLANIQVIGSGLTGSELERTRTWANQDELEVLKTGKIVLKNGATQEQAIGSNIFLEPSFDTSGTEPIYSLKVYWEPNSSQVYSLYINSEEVISYADFQSKNNLITDGTYVYYECTNLDFKQKYDFELYTKTSITSIFEPVMTQASIDAIWKSKLKDVVGSDNNRIECGIQRMFEDYDATTNGWRLDDQNRLAAGQIAGQRFGEIYIVYRGKLYGSITSRAYGENDYLTLQSSENNSGFPKFHCDVDVEDGSLTITAKLSSNTDQPLTVVKQADYNPSSQNTCLLLRRDSEYINSYVKTIPAKYAKPFNGSLESDVALNIPTRYSEEYTNYLTSLAEIKAIELTYSFAQENPTTYTYSTVRNIDFKELLNQLELGTDSSDGKGYYEKKMYLYLETLSGNNDAIALGSDGDVQTVLSATNIFKPIRMDVKLTYGNTMSGTRAIATNSVAFGQTYADITAVRTYGISVAADGTISW